VPADWTTIEGNDRIPAAFLPPQEESVLTLTYIAFAGRREPVTLRDQLPG
jgi:hypothetical protein